MTNVLSSSSWPWKRVASMPSSASVKTACAAERSASRSGRSKRSLCSRTLAQYRSPISSGCRSFSTSRQRSRPCARRRGPAAHVGGRRLRVGERPVRARRDGHVPGFRDVAAECDGLAAACTNGAYLRQAVSTASRVASIVAWLPTLNVNQMSVGLSVSQLRPCATAAPNAPAVGCGCPSSRYDTPTTIANRASRLRCTATLAR